MRHVVISWRVPFFMVNNLIGLDGYFLQCLREDIEKLESTGGIHEQYHGFHRSLSERFPYAIYYLVSGEFVGVVATSIGLLASMTLRV